MHLWGSAAGTMPTPPIATDDRVSVSLSLGLFAQGEPISDADDEYQRANRVTRTRTQGICIFVEWATSLPKQEFVKMYADLTQTRIAGNPIIFKHTIQQAFSMRKTIQQVTPCTEWFRAIQVKNTTHKETHQLTVFADTRDKVGAIRIMLPQLEITIDEAFHHIADIIRNIDIPSVFVQLAAEAAIRKMTWRLPFVFDETFVNRKYVLKSKALALQIYYQQKRANSTHKTECVHLFTEEHEALAELRSHVQQRYNAGDPTLATTEQNVMSLLIGEMEELETALSQGHTSDVVDEVGDVLYMASHAGPTNQGQYPSNINPHRLATVFTSTQSTMNLIHCMRTWRVETIEAGSSSYLQTIKKSCTDPDRTHVTEHV